MSGFFGHRERAPSTRGSSSKRSSGVERSYASQLKEHEPLFTTYEHLKSQPRGDSALTMLRKVASMVKPIMRKRGWRVQVLAEFLPQEQNLLGLNINKGYKICIRLRYHNNPDLFLPLEEVIDTMLHELSHIIWGEHDSRFHALWDELRDEYEVLMRKGYTGEGFLSAGHRVGGSTHRLPPPHEIRRLARASAEKRQAQGTLGRGSGQRLGGAAIHNHGGDIRRIIADQATRRNAIDRGCASGRQDAGEISNQASNNAFKTKAEEDDANDRAIAQALYELMEEEEAEKLRGSHAQAIGSSSPAGLAWDAKYGLYDASVGQIPISDARDSTRPSFDEQMNWALRESLNNTEPQSVSPPHPAPPSQSKIVSSSGVSHQTQDDHKAPSSKRKLPTSPQSLRHSRRSVSPKIAPRPDDKVHVTSSIDLQAIPINSSTDPNGWTCPTCTLINPLQFLSCDACSSERPQKAIRTIPKRFPNQLASANVKPKRTITRVEDIKLPPEKATMGWNCVRCGSFMEHQWWTCSACGLMKEES